MLAAVTLLVSLLLALLVVQAGRPAAATFGLALFPPVAVYLWRTGSIRRRHAILGAPFPPEWEAVLQRDVLYFRVLDGAAQSRFRRQLQVFLGEKRITGIRVKLDTTTRVLAAASAIIPIFGFPDWEWDQISEVLVYPNRFDGDFRFGDQQGQTILGMVGTGSLNRLMILSQPDLIQGFRNATDKRNVGVHEFAHLVDMGVFPLLKSLLPVVVAFLLPTTDTLDHRRVGNGTHRHGLFQEPMEELPAMA